MSTFAVETVAAAIRASSMRLPVGQSPQKAMCRRELASHNVNVNLHLHWCQAVSEVLANDQLFARFKKISCGSATGRGNGSEDEICPRLQAACGSGPRIGAGQHSRFPDP